MPELPDIAVYIECLERRVLGEPLEQIRIASPFVLRSVSPPIGATQGKRVRRLFWISKRIVLGLDDDLFVILH